MDNNRKFERFDITAPARIEILTPEASGEKILLESHNLSAGGVFIKSDQLLPDGCLVKVEIFLNYPDTDTQSTSECAKVIVVSGCVVRSTNEGMAICFNDDYNIISAEYIKNV